jgi:thioredoxin 2
MMGGVDMRAKRARPLRRRGAPVIRTCPSCQTKNRIPPDRLSDTGRCGACKAPLPPLAEALEVDAREFADIVRTAKVPVLVDFWAPWCGPCRMATPEVARAAAHFAGKAIVLKVNTDEHPELSSRYGVQGIPHFVVLRDGQVVVSQAGLVRAAQLFEWIERASGATPRRAHVA